MVSKTTLVCTAAYTSSYGPVCKNKLPYSRKFSPGEKFHLFHPGALWAKFFRQIILPSEKFVTLKFLQAQVFTHGCQAILVVPRDHQSAVLPGIQNLFFLDLQPSFDKTNVVWE